VKPTLSHAFIIAAITLGAAHAADTPSPPDKDKDPKKLEPAREAIARGDWGSARVHLARILGQDPANADAHNRYAFAERKSSAPRMDVVCRHYNEALRLDPGHRGAHEYLGEAYLMGGNPGKAREHPEILAKLCPARCEERSVLQAALGEALAARGHQAGALT